MKEQEIKKAVREGYARIAVQGGSCCSPGTSCCGSSASAQAAGKAVGYTEEDLGAVPGGANMGLGCGNPVALASLKEGEVVLDLGAGGGFDCFLAARRVGRKGKVIGVDMTPEMVDKARENARRGAYANVEFRLGEIENLPAADSSVDAVISNCVINLAADKRRVFEEAFRVLKPGGRVMISDLVLLRELPAAVRSSIEAYVGCIAGAMQRDDYLQIMRDAGLKKVKVVEETVYPLELAAGEATVRALARDLKLSDTRLRDLAGSVVSVKVEAVKPAGPARKAGKTAR